MLRVQHNMQSLFFFPGCFVNSWGASLLIKNSIYIALKPSISRKIRYRAGLRAPIRIGATIAVAFSLSHSLSLSQPVLSSIKYHSHAYLSFRVIGPFGYLDLTTLSATRLVRRLQTLC